MKRCVAIIILVFGLSLQVYSQTTVKPGIRVGANFSNFTDSDLDFRASFYIGGFAAVKLTRFYTLQPEINYTQQGAKATFSNPEITNHAPEKIEFNYLSLGVLNKITFTDKIFVLAGPMLDFKVNGSSNSNADLDLAATLGFGYTLPMGLTIEARAKLGIIDVLESDDYNNADNDVKDWNSNYVFQIGIAYSFDVKGTTK
ncbi:outer membrane beta-barrel protein [Flavobacterium sp. DG1-102-2]|uniref:outer membrane beta-barrel protein n=1 Tax=Flavobacterium sp. DG1-102-2 TaxID=3081663 RepID=UPI002949402F|nr:outer membrane beta-barrel protein [Flavobacterium sp. DG1-102-2]MDV6169279.1 outer membrane beta-barrel protein [Flavobacterium sp. DG1-102-2]